jgi:hypothetical protein
MHRQQSNARSDYGLHPGVHGARDIVKFQIEHILRLMSHECPADDTTITVERLVTDLKEHIEGTQEVDQRDGALGVWDVERDDKSGMIHRLFIFARTIHPFFSF